MFLISPIVLLKQHHENLETTSECQEPTASFREIPQESTDPTGEVPDSAAVL